MESNGFTCDSPVPSKYLQGGALEKLPQLVSDVCFYSCFASILYELAINRYTSIANSLSSAGKSLVAIARYILEEGIGTDGALNSMMETILDSLSNIGKNIGDAASVSYDSFTNGFWAFAKGILFRSAGPILLAAIQSLMDHEKEALIYRANLLGEIEKKLDELTATMNRLVGYDWWEEYVQSVLLAARYVNDARRETGQAYNNFLNNKWDSTRLSMAQDQMMSAWRLLSSDDMTSSFLTELGDFTGDVIDGGGYQPFDGSFLGKEWQDFCEDMESVVTLIGELKDMHECLVLTSSQAELYQALIAMAAQTLDSMAKSNGEILDLSMFPDVNLGQSNLKDVYEGLTKIYLQMKDVVENEKRTFAPIYNSQWRAQLRMYILMLVGVGYFPDEWGFPSPPLGFESAGALQASNDLVQYIVFPHSPDDGKKSLSEYSFGASEVGRKLKEFIIVMGSITEMLTCHSQWSRRMQSLKNSIKNMKNHDMQAASMCEQFEGYGSAEYDYLLNLFESLKWTTAVKYLESGRIQQLLALTATGLVQTITLADCIGGNIGGMEDIGIAKKAAELTGAVSADARIAGRSSLALPSFQFQALTGIQSKLNDTANQIEDILKLQDEVC